MPRDGFGVAAPPASTAAVSGETISSTKRNSIDTDIYSILNGIQPVALGGTGAANAEGAQTNLGILTDFISAVAAQTFSDAQKLQARTNIGAAPDTVASVVVGSLHWFPMASAPTGYLKANGNTIGSASSGATARANADTSALFTVLWDNLTNAVLPIQDSSGAASTRGASAAADFAANKRLPLPDMRGEWLRSYSDGRASVDVARVLGSSQAEMIGPHGHTASASTDGAHTHGVQGGGGSGSSAVYRDGSDTGYNGTTSSNGAHTHTITVATNTGTENRVRNLAFLCCIKY